MKNPIVWVVVVVFLIILAVGCYFAYQWISNKFLSNPEVVIVRPDHSPTIDLSEGLLLTVLARSKIGLQNISFLVDGAPIDQMYSSGESVNDMQASFTWLPRSTGVYRMEFLAVDQNGRQSEPAVLPVVVTSEGLSQVEVDAITSQAESIPVVNVVSNDGSGAVDSGADEGVEQIGNPDVGFESPENNNGGEAGDGHMPDVGFERPENSDHPPVITNFAVDVQPGGDGADVAVSVTAEDDNGVDRIFVAAYSNVNQEIPIQVEHVCGGVSPCSLVEPSSLAAGAEYNIIAVAVDTAGQESAVHNELVEVADNPPPGEGAAIAEEAPGVDLPEEFFEGLIVNREGIIQVNPFFQGGVVFDNEGGDAPEEDEECEPTTFEDVRAVITDMEYYNDFMPRIHMQMIIPPCMETDVEDPYLFLQVGSQPLSENTRRHCPGPFTEDTYENGEIRENIISMSYCGLGELELYPVLQKPDRELVFGTPTSFTPLLCGTKPPDFISLRSSDDCASSESCLYLTWEYREDFRNRLQPDHYVLIENRFGWSDFIEQEFIIPFGENSYVREGTLPNRVHEYEIYSVSAEGVRSNPNRINIRTPAPGEDLNIETHDWQEAR